MPNLSRFRNEQVKEILCQNWKNLHKYEVLSEDKKNGLVSNAQVLPVIIKAKKNLLTQSNKKKLILTQEENKISQKFTEAFQYEVRRVDRRLNDIVIEEY